MVSLIMMADSVAKARSREVNRQILNHIIPIGWMLIVMITLVLIYVWYRANSDRKVKRKRG